jgi:hypothetical protein
MLWQLIAVLFGMIALIAGVILVYYAISFLVLRCVSFLFPLAGRRKRPAPIANRQSPIDNGNAGGGNRTHTER